MNVVGTDLGGVVVIEPRVLEDARGVFYERYHRARFRDLGIDVEFVQDNVSRSRPGVLRGLHYQVRTPQAKLIRVTAGAVWDVAVDLRQGSPTFGRHAAVELSATNRRMVYIPAGFAHGFCALDEAEVDYQCSGYYDPTDDLGIAWNDPALAIRWPLLNPILSARDQAHPPLARATLPALA